MYSATSERRLKLGRKSGSIGMPVMGDSSGLLPVCAYVWCVCARVCVLVCACSRDLACQHFIRALETPTHMLTDAHTHTTHLTARGR